MPEEDKVDESSYSNSMQDSSGSSYSVGEQNGTWSTTSENVKLASEGDTTGR